MFLALLNVKIVELGTHHTCMHQVYHKRTFHPARMLRNVQDLPSWPQDCSGTDMLHSIQNRAVDTTSMPAMHPLQGNRHRSS